ncbi:MAG TPA: hypothetical protein VL947_09675, partial [Cytophagales bacterium]|nr:hypothetical protein [Cytophagales bacterium]
MKPLHCPLRTRKRNKVLFKVIDHLSIDELVWLKSRDQKKALFLDYLHHTYPEQLKLIKAYSETNEILLIFPLEVIDIDLSNLYKEKAGLWGTLSKKILSMCRFKIAHPSYSILYDQDLTVYDLECITEADKYQIMAEAIEDMSRLHCLNIVTIPLSTPEHEKIFKNKRYNRPIEDFTMELALDPEWTCFHDYIAALKRKYNKRASSIRKKMDTLEVRTLEKEEI